MQAGISKPSAITLFTNHMDAWGVTFIITSAYVLIHQVFAFQSLVLLLWVTIGYWFGFAVNDYFDRHIDALDPLKKRRNYFIAIQFSDKSIVLLSGLLLAGLGIIGFWQFGWRGIGMFALSIFIVWGYSAPPLRLKSRPILDLLTHALFVQTYPYLLCIVLLDMPLSSVDFLLLACFVLSSLAAQLEQQTRDYETDKHSDNNFTVTFGKALSLRLLKVVSTCLMGVVLFGVLSGIMPLFLVPIILIGMPIVLHRFMRGHRTPRSEKLVKVLVVLALVYMMLVWLVALIG